MKIQKDENNLLTIFNENIPQTKEYTYNVSGYLFSDFDKWIIVLHKKEWKIINLKNLGDTMSVVYMKKSGNKELNFNKEACVQATTIFQGFDEETGKKYAFIPNLTEKEGEEKNEIFKKLGLKQRIQKTSKGMICENNDDANTYKTKEEIFSYLLWLVILYGKFEGKNKELNTLKIQVPLFGQYIKEQENLDDMVASLQKEWIFIKGDKMTNKNGIVYQISSNDYELLEIYTKWYEPVEKFEKITKLEFTQEMKAKLVEFLQNNAEIPQEGKVEVLKQLQEWTIKLLTK